MPTRFAERSAARRWLEQVQSLSAPRHTARLLWPALDRTSAASRKRPRNAPKKGGKDTIARIARPSAVFRVRAIERGSCDHHASAKSHFVQPIALNRRLAPPCPAARAMCFGCALVVAVEPARSPRLGSRQRRAADFLGRTEARRRVHEPRSTPTRRFLSRQSIRAASFSRTRVLVAFHLGEWLRLERSSRPHMHSCGEETTRCSEERALERPDVRHLADRGVLGRQRARPRARLANDHGTNSLNALERNRVRSAEPRARSSGLVLCADKIEALLL